MSMNKKELYFKDLEDIITDSIFIGSSEYDLDEEIANNMWHISSNIELIKALTLKDYRDFFNRVIQNRRDQIIDSTQNHGMIFYLWFDQLACQLRFSLISDLHKKLPFQCDLEILKHMDDIILAFLNSPFHDGLPIEGYNDNIEEKPYILKIYQTMLSKD
ncbi:hypothetical protein BVG16_26710 [Paenibacillus selenitireducens]|uniref:Uncharacterized protein n=1 Tax=Paenibacillus selenitireducens TaxID=1324314 RepID=A0A1T2X1B2_9BACL|nr:hypothetical protein [Paenibacillus selenitireducens]OPA73688.1 hypothetical protein BVG16_26710 [Paenibacillus selenitireducens]